MHGCSFCLRVGARNAKVLDLACKGRERRGQPCVLSMSLYVQEHDGFAQARGPSWSQACQRTGLYPSNIDIQCVKDAKCANESARTMGHGDD